MNTNAIILHGTCDRAEYYSEKFPSLSNSHWIPWLQKQLLIHDVFATTPEFFQAYNPNYDHWKFEFEKNKIDENTILVGHSCGGVFLLRWLSENKKISVKKVVLVAPWLDPQNTKNNNFFDFEFDTNLTKRIPDITIFNSTNDDADIHESLQIIQKNIPHIEVKNFENYGHFCFSDLGTEKFPELLAKVLS